MPTCPTVAYSCCGCSLKVGTFYTAWFFLVVDISILSLYVVESVEAKDTDQWRGQPLDYNYLLQVRHSPLDAFQGKGGDPWWTKRDVRDLIDGNRPVQKPRGLLMVQIPLAAGCVVVDVMLLVGVWTDSRVLLLTWSCVALARAGAEAVLLIATVVKCVHVRAAPSWVTLRVALRFFVICCESYCAMVTYSYYRKVAALCKAFERHHANMYNTS